MEAEPVRPLRVFISHTSELAAFPEKRSFVDAACAAVRRAGGVAVDMADFGAREQRSPQVCRAEVLGCDVYLGVIGFRYGTPVPENGVSYTEFEFDVAGQAGMPRLVFLLAGFSLGALPAQKLAQTRPGALGAVLYHGGVPVDTFGMVWPAAVALQLHVAEHDEWTELDVAQDLARNAPHGELYVYPGSAHLITDSSLAEYDQKATELIIQRTNTFLQRFQ